MALEVIASLLSAILSLVAGGLASSGAVNKLVRILFNLPAEDTKKTYSERLAELTGSLTKATAEVDAVLSELSTVAKDRESTVKKLEMELGQLEQREKELNERIEALKNTPIPVAEHFAAMLQKGEKRSARRDYVLFGAGVVVTTVISLVFQLATKR